ncbi:hypothetical protein BU17DRAFT_71653 [Hysterangium stoloniferum]|nr:hypothetical protein BU17DRAFT_71653 [Hysterangium stoloniferum]
MGKAALEYSCPWYEAGVPRQTRARIAAFPDIFVVHATNFLHVRQGGKPFLEGSSHPKPVFSQGVTGIRNLGNSGDMASTLQSISTLPAFAYIIPYPFSPRPVPAPNSSSRLALPGLTPASPVQKPPPSQSSVPPHSQPFPTGRCQKALFATGKAVVVLIGHVEVVGSNNPSVQSKVAPASDSGPEPSVE